MPGFIAPAPGQALAGFTVIEALITVAIIAIVAAIAFPSYQSQVLKARRADGQSLLFDVAAREEQFYLDNKTYTTDMTQLGFSTDPIVAQEGRYSVDTAAGPTGSIATSFVATATRRGAQVADTHCGDFTIDSNGNTSVINYAGYGSSPPPTTCW